MIYQLQRLIVAKFVLWLIVQGSVGMAILYSFLIYLPEVPWFIRAVVGAAAFLLIEKLVIERHLKLYLFKIDEEWLTGEIRARTERRAKAQKEAVLRT